MARTTAVSDRQLTLTHLDRQLLLARRPLTVPDAIRRLVALQSQYSPSPYIALLARVEGFAPPALEAALGRGRVVKSSLMRGTLHLVHASDYPYFAAAWRVQARTSARAASRHAAGREPELVAALATFLAEARTTDQIRAFLGGLAGDVVAAPARLDFARAHLPLVHVPPSNFWRQHGKFSLRAWPAALPSPLDGTIRLVHSYLTAFGPASREDIAAFTWLRYRELDPAIAAISPRRLVDPSGRELLDLPRRRLMDESTVPPLRFLARWDAALISHRDRSRIVPDAAAPRLFGEKANGEVPATYLVDGLVAGTWRDRLAGTAATLTLDPIDGQPVPTDPEVEREAEALLRMLHPTAASWSVESTRS